jgi:DNA-binding transcriptional ArsR family regulator
MHSDLAPGLASFAAVFADQTRASMCLALLDGTAWTAGELASHAGVARSTATEHLNLLERAGVLTAERQGRHRYVRLADEGIASLVETLAAQAPRPTRPATGLRAVTANAALARARTCYDHLAGSLGVAVTDALIAHKLISRRDGWTLTRDGAAWLSDIGVDVDAVRAARRPFIRTCLDWTERRPHLAGGVGAALCNRFLEAGWLERIGTDRSVRLTPTGERSLNRSLDLNWTP